MTVFSLGVLLVSSALQLLAAIFAVRLNRQTTSSSHAWLLLSSAMVLMLSRRMATLLGLFFPRVERIIAGPIAETIALLIATLMLLGVLRIPQVFRSLREIASALKVSLEERERLYGQAQDAVRLRDEFLSVASHELRTPITTLQLSLQGLLGGLLPDTPEVRTRALHLAERQTRKLGRLISELLDVSRVESGWLPSELAEVDLTTVTREVCERLAPDLSQAACTLVLRAQAPVVGRWDHASVDRVISNLLANAIKFAAGKSIEIEIQLAEVVSTARLIVRDSGIGIPPEILPHVFDRFVRGVSAERYGGFGLGLYIVDGIVRALGGTVRAESTMGAGSLFTVELPTAGPPARRPPTSNPGRQT